MKKKTNPEIEDENPVRGTWIGVYTGEENIRAARGEIKRFCEIISLQRFTHILFQNIIFVSKVRSNDSFLLILIGFNLVSLETEFVRLCALNCIGNIIIMFSLCATCTAIVDNRDSIKTEYYKRLGRERLIRKRIVTLDVYRIIR